jgi:hypothetical protein
MDPVEKLLFEANTIASIPKGARISTHQEFINIEQPYVGQSILRAINRDSREKAVTCVCQRVQLLIKISTIMLESRFLSPNEQSDMLVEREKRIILLKKIHIALANVCDGINSLCDTYSDDANVIANLKPLLVNVDNQVAVLSRFLMEIGEYTDPKTNQLYLSLLTKN